MKKTIQLIPFLLLLACTSQPSETIENEVSEQDRIDTLSQEEYDFGSKSNHFTGEMSKRNMDKFTDFYAGDTILFKLNYKGQDDFLNEHHLVGIRPESENLTVNRTGPGTFELIIDENTEDRFFSFQPYVSSDRVVFEDSHFDTLKGFTKNKYSNAMSPYIKTYEITGNK